MTAYHSGNSVPHIHVDDQFAGFDQLDWDNSDRFTGQAFHEHGFSGHFFSTKEQSYHQQQIAHKPLDRFVYAHANEDPFAYGLHSPGQANSQAQTFPAAAAVPGQFDSFHLPLGIHDGAWSRRLSSPVDTIFSYNSGGNNNYLPADTPSNQTFDSLRNSQSPVSSEYHLQTRSPSQSYHLATSIDGFSNEDGSCIALREIQQVPDMSSFQNGSSSSAAVADNIITLPSQHHGAHVSEEDALHEVDAEGELDDEAYGTGAHAPVPTADDALESDPEPADSNDTTSKSDGSDSDYKPSRGARAARNRNNRRSSGTHRRRPSSTLAEPSANRVNKRQTAADRRPSATRSPRTPSFNRANSSNGAAGNAAAAVDRPFTCPLMPYGCRATFASKNEWKRHFNIQHVCLGFWRCDLCPDAQTRPNDFNRKDLFKQHLRRMHRSDKGCAIAHAPASSPATSPHPPADNNNNNNDDDDAFEAALEAVRMRCWVQLRSPPARLACVFCSDASAERTFDGPACTEEWLEHVGRHLASAAARRDGRLVSAEGRAEMRARWQADATLRAWLIREGLVEPRADGRYALADRVVASEAAQRRRSAGLEADELRD